MSKEDSKKITSQEVYYKDQERRIKGNKEIREPKFQIYVEKIDLV